jgi:hypothetical protein
MHQRDLVSFYAFDSMMGVMVYGMCCRMPGRPCSRHERTPIVDLALAWDWGDWVFMGFGDILE